MFAESDLRVSCHLDGSIVVVTVEGEVDLDSVGALRAVALPSVALPDATAIVLDLDPVTFMDSSGLRLLIELDRAARKLDRRLFLTRGDEELQRLFQLSGITGRLAIVDDISEVREQ